jgi:hypothetical protein
MSARICTRSANYRTITARAADVTTAAMRNKCWPPSLTPANTRGSFGTAAYQRRAWPLIT